MTPVPAPRVPAAPTLLAGAGTDLMDVRPPEDGVHAAVAPGGHDDPLPPEAEPVLLAEFLAEAREGLADAEAALLALEATPEDVTSVHVVLRAFHTIKGTAGFLGLERLTAVAHHAESLLTRVRDGILRCSPPVADLALQAVDLVRDLLDACEAGQRTGRLPLPAAYTATLAALAEAVTAPAPTPAVVSRPALAPGRAAVGADATVRVRRGELRALADLAERLAATQARLAADVPTRGGRQPDLARAVADLGSLTRDLQALVVALRLTSFKPTFRRLARLVRDVARRTGKAVVFRATGEDVEIDRGMADHIGEPLIHMLRNAIDHGIESPAERERGGKARRGLVSLRVARDGEDLVVTVRDDGRGLDAARIRAKATQLGLLAPGDVPAPEDVYPLIFAPGVSTAEQVTDLSGRGVGMDVVRERVEALQGGIGIESVPGQGATFTIRLPLAPTGPAAPSRPSVAVERVGVPMHRIPWTWRPSAASSILP